MKVNKMAVEIALAKKSMNMCDLCENTKISPSTVSKGLNGKSEFSPKTVGRIAQALGCDVEDIIQKEA